MKILYLLSDPAHRGLHRQTGYMTHVREVMAALGRAGHEVTLFDARLERMGGRSTAAPATGRSEPGGGGVVARVPPRLRAVGRDLLYWWRNRSLEAALERTFAGRSFDLVYERFHHFQSAGARWAHRHGVPHFLEFNAGQDEIAAFHGAGLSAWARRQEDRILAASDRVFPVSAVLRERLVARGHDPDRLVVLHNAADPVRFRPDGGGDTVRARFGIERSEVLVGFVGSFAVWHGVEQLVEAAADPRLRALPVRFLLAGSASDSPARKAVEARVRRHGLGDRIVLAGRIGHEEVPALLAAVDIAVMPWTNEYGSPLKLFEYMAMGKAIVAPDRPVIREILQPEAEALLAGPDASSLANAIHRLATDEALRRRLAASVRRRVETEHNWDHHAAVIEREWGLVRGAAPPGGSRD